MGGNGPHCVDCTLWESRDGRHTSTWTAPSSVYPKPDCLPQLPPAPDRLKSPNDSLVFRTKSKLLTETHKALLDELRSVLSPTPYSRCPDFRPTQPLRFPEEPRLFPTERPLLVLPLLPCLPLSPLTPSPQAGTIHTPASMTAWHLEDAARPCAPGRSRSKARHCALLNTCAPSLSPATPEVLRGWECAVPRLASAQHPVGTCYCTYLWNRHN